MPDDGGTRRRALLAVALTGVVAYGAVAPLTVAAAAPAVPSLAGTVTLAGTTTAYVTVRLPKAATLLNPFVHRDVRFSTGTGRYLGFVLTDSKPGGIRIQGGEQVGTKLAPYAIGVQGISNGGDFALPAGVYRLYLLADGAPATVTLRFKGLAGATTLRPAHRVPYAVSTPELLVSPGGTLAIGGAEGTLHGAGLAFDVLSEVNAQFLASNTTLCFYDSAPPPQPVGYGPGCPGGEPIPLTTVAPGVGGSTGGIYSGIADLPAGTFGLGFNRAGASVTDSLTYTVGFLTFDAAGTEPATPVPPGRPGRGSGGGTTAPPGRTPSSPGAMPATGLPGGVAAVASALVSVAWLLRRRATASARSGSSPA